MCLSQPRSLKQQSELAWFLLHRSYEDWHRLSISKAFEYLTQRLSFWHSVGDLNKDLKSGTTLVEKPWPLRPKPAAFPTSAAKWIGVYPKWFAAFTFVPSAMSPSCLIEGVVISMNSHWRLTSSVLFVLFVFSSGSFFSFPIPSYLTISLLSKHHSDILSRLN